MTMPEIYKELAKTTLPPTDHSELMLEILSLAMTPDEAEAIRLKLVRPPEHIPAEHPALIA